MSDTPPSSGARLPLLIEEAELRLVRLPLLTPFRIATGTMTERLFPLLRLRGEGLDGWAEGVMDPLPDYLDETLAGTLSLLREGILPGILGRRFVNPEALARQLRPWRGHAMARAMVEMAFWDLWSRALGLPLGIALGGDGRAAVPVGVSLGLGSVDETLESVARHLDAGYRRIKLKIAPGHDIALLKAMRLRFPAIALSVDANASYLLADRARLRSFDAFGLDYVEQPLAWDDLLDHATLQRELATAICLDESLRSVGHARRALQLDAARVLNIKVARVGGHDAARRMHDLAEAFDVPVWCGGMLESGVGRAHNIHLSTLPNFTKPGDVSSASRYFARDIVQEPLEATDGLMPVPQGPGIGVTPDEDALATVADPPERIRP